MKNFIILILLILIFILTGCKQVESENLVTTSPIKVEVTSKSAQTTMLPPLPNGENDSIFLEDANPWSILDSYYDVIN